MMDSDRPRPTKSEKARNFYRKILGSDPTDPETDAKETCNAWLDLLGGDWVWLWLSDDHGGAKHWQVVSCNEKDQKVKVPRTITRRSEKKFGVFDYVNRMQKVERIDSLSWSASVNKVDYEVVAKDELQDLGCESFVCIPISTGSEKSKPEDVKLEGAICVHFRSGLPKFDIDSETLLWMGALSAQSLASSYRELQNNVLLELNQLAASYLSEKLEEPKEVRRKYIQSVVSLIRDQLNVTGVSIFYQPSKDANDRVICIGSTGLAEFHKDSGNFKKILEPEDYARASYSYGERKTGLCLETGNILRYPFGVKKELEPPRYYEFIQSEGSLEPDLESPTLFVPIPVDDSAPKGVIRCTDHHAPSMGGVLRNFDSLEIQTLGFIANQISSVVESLTNNIYFSKQVAYVRHELENTFSMVNSIVRKYTDHIDSDDTDGEITVRKFDLIDIGISSKFAVKLSQRLWADPIERGGDLDPEPVYVYGDVIASIGNIASRYAKQSKRITLKIDSKSFRKIPQLYLQPYFLDHSLWNIIMNAIKYGYSSTTINVRAILEEDYYSIDVENQGPGILKSEIDSIFEEGFRGEASQTGATKALGSGLGLPIARNAIERIGGRIAIKSLAKPTLFSIQIPKHKDKIPTFR